MKSEHKVRVKVIDQNDSPSSPRSVHVMIYSLNEQIPVGKIADIRPIDPDSVGDYSCKILQSSSPNILSIPKSCDLHISKITQGVGYSLSVAGNDGLHSDVLSKVSLEFVTFNNSTIDNTATIKIAKLKASKFLDQFYRAFLDKLQEGLNSGEAILVYSIEESGDDLLIFVAIDTPQGFMARNEVVEYLSRKSRTIRSLVEAVEMVIGYSPCENNSCQNGGSCEEKLVIGEGARISDSQSLILTSPLISHQVTCTCADGFTGDRCDKKQDPCSPNPCHVVGF